jgi:hypothetical protein
MALPAYCFNRLKAGICIIGCVYAYICIMKNEITIPVLKEEDLIAANMRRDKYAHVRDLQALELNEAIATRLLAKDRNQVKCEKCGKEFAAGLTTNVVMTCPECK